ncbi:type II toxin-antitoxin system HicA family toxin [Treponema denticola]|uniref:Type II toxin-antitoxin system HicA family toxin n=2 Tax=Treponema TaxID=157 RepID=A0A9Q9EXE5_TREDN|nr:type II toxin-antitoxin system HicA family toxin [Treponema denticola]UTC90331.1 type II toxin-antitoxin system HicA family toxin [Treponema denticola]UTD00317.1 type II toxin-antitoxin system HicA family toxin [Treponema denticola]
MTGKEITKILKKNGWTIDRIKGSHHIFIKDDKTIPVPVHGNKDLPIGTVKNIFRLAGIKER